MPRQVLHRPGHAHSTMLRLLVTVCLGAFVVAVIALTGSGLLLEGPQPPLERADAIVVISGDESQARLSEEFASFQGWLGTQTDLFRSCTGRCALKRASDGDDRVGARSATKCYAARVRGHGHIRQRCIHASDHGV